MNTQIHHEVEQFLFANAARCDAQDWDGYLEDFSPEAEFHVPQWDSEHEYTRDPKTGMSLIYYPNRTGLEDRVFRIRTGKSAASTPMPRTLHLLNNLRVTELDGDRVEAAVNWHTLYYRLATAEQMFGRATYILAKQPQGWRILRKHALLLNDMINAVLDFYHL
ncbi:anthranilate 1,2-dioxygenase small subunit [Acidocella sp. KAb 2-4]|uniref:anthranilate 1,2-dioxygenase small subunit n=1 Tax=Acidocella sp. KAb 2-4 TaxID=2885158 RepID=UPI001D06233A|nr:anthranilate 1,2-dioxygenase small subunit [Acidocella sp. KAb 2-4]MCB5945577.1 anthranilate 1,2-dioxygenase small subunit [Acidocella sp. KAb 2-4]